MFLAEFINKTCIRNAISRMQRVQMSYDSEKIVAKIKKGKTTAHTDPIDIITKNEAIEVKAVHKDAVEFKCRMEKDAIDRKLLFCKKAKKDPLTVMAVINDTIELYERAGFGNFRKENMAFIGKFDRK